MDAMRLPEAVIYGWGVLFSAGACWRMGSDASQAAIFLIPGALAVVGALFGTQPRERVAMMLFTSGLTLLLEGILFREIL